MPITEQQREKRKTRLGSSDMAAVLGVSPFATAHDIYLEKTDKLEPEKKEPETYKYAGNVFEKGILDDAERILGKLDRGPEGHGVEVVADIGVPIGSFIDAIVVAPKIEGVCEGDPVEAKTAGLYGPLVEEWGEDGTDEVPDRIIIQDQASRCVIHQFFSVVVGLLCTASHVTGKLWRA